jgi:tRNA (adenine57-N1/adenine58-N1)-methyltransferase
VLPEFKSRPAKSDFADEDVAVWNPDHLSAKKVGEKKLRKNLRNASAAAENSVGRSNE